MPENICAARNKLELLSVQCARRDSLPCNKHGRSRHWRGRRSHQVIAVWRTVGRGVERITTLVRIPTVCMSLQSIADCHRKGRWFLLGETIWHCGVSKFVHLEGVVKQRSRRFPVLSCWRGRKSLIRACQLQLMKLLIQVTEAVVLTQRFLVDS